MEEENLSISVDLYSYNYEKLVNRTLEVCKTDNRQLVEAILLQFGSKVDSKYVILNCDYYEEYSCYYNVSEVLDKVFKVDDTFSEIFCTYYFDNNNALDETTLISTKCVFDAMEELAEEGLV